jgi:hypothetical protein
MSCPGRASTTSSPPSSLSNARDLGIGKFADTLHRSELVATVIGKFAQDQEASLNVAIAQPSSKAMLNNLPTLNRSWALDRLTIRACE